MAARRGAAALALGLALCGGGVCAPGALAAQSADNNAPAAASSEGERRSSQQYFLGSVVNAGTDTGYTRTDDIKENDPQFGWSLGSFSVSGFTRVVDGASDSPVFLKNVGDDVWLNFNLAQDLDCLNGNDRLSISDDANGYDEQMGVAKTDMGRGTLIIRHTNYDNSVDDPVVYTNFLSAESSVSASTGVRLSEEGDYEVALDYEIRNDVRRVGSFSAFPEYSNYRIAFTFSIRNGNCMVYPFDVTTGAELADAAFTENGFRLDLAKSRYLDIDVQREVLAPGDDPVLDVRFNRPARDGEEFTDEGVYTITAHNAYTGQTTTKRLYVGTDDLLKAYVANDGMSLADVKAKLDEGATVDEDGYLVGEAMHAPESGAADADVSAKEGIDAAAQPALPVGAIVGGAVALVCVVAGVVALVMRRRGGGEGRDEVPGDGEEASGPEKAEDADAAADGAAEPEDAQTDVEPAEPEEADRDDDAC